MAEPNTPSRRIEVAPQRLTGWIESFAQRHGGSVTAQSGPDAVIFRAADGAVAQCQVPFPPLADGPSADPVAVAERLAGHAQADRTVGVFLVRLGGYAAGVFTGPEPVLVASKVGSRLVHGRSAAGGQSQRRFARRREKQAHEALNEAAEKAATVFRPYRLDALVLGGDRRTMAGLMHDNRLAPYFPVAVKHFLTVPDPRLTVLQDTPRLFRAIRITLTEPSA